MAEIKRTKVIEGVSIPLILFGSYQVREKEVLKNVLMTSLENGIMGFDTSPSYGNQDIFGEMLNACTEELSINREKIFLTGKIDGWQMCRSNGNVEKYVDQQMKVLKVDYLDLMLIHWPFERYLFNTWKCLEKIYSKGKIKAIGLCNVNKRVLDKLNEQDIKVKPQVIQNEISPLRCATDEVTYFQNRKICVEAYSPLARMFPAVKDSTILKKIAEKHNKSIAQVILRWHVQRGIVPVFTSSKPERLISNIDIFDFTLSEDDIEMINCMDQNYKIFPESYGCPGF